MTIKDQSYNLHKIFEEFVHKFIQKEKRVLRPNSIP